MEHQAIAELGSVEQPAKTILDLPFGGFLIQQFPELGILESVLFRECVVHAEHVIDAASQVTDMRIVIDAHQQSFVGHMAPFCLSATW
jgi:hypothetical protein